MLRSLRNTIAGGVRRPYLGQVATRCFAHNSNAVVGTGINSRTAHYARDNITSLQIVHGNWWTHSTVGDEGLGGTQTITASVEYPAGVYHQAKFGGSTSVVLPDLAQTVTDPVFVTIPKGALFYTKKYQICSNAFSFCGLNDPTNNVSLGDILNNSNTDETMTASVDVGSPSFIPPLAIIAQTKLPSIGIMGTSRFIGLGDTVLDTTGDLGYCRLLGDQFAYCNMSASGDTMASFLNSPKRLAVIDQYCSHQWFDPGLNDLAAGTTGSTAAGYLTSLINGRANRSRVIVNDNAPITTSTDSWATTANQSSVPYEAERVALNSAIAALQGVNQVVRVASLETANGSSFAWTVNGSGAPSGPTADGSHETTAQIARLKANNPFTASMVR